MDLYRSKHSDKKYSNRNSSSNDRPSRSFRNSNDDRGSRYSRDDRGSRNSRDNDREDTTVTCADCGDQCTVPFVPRSDKPVYCSDCFRKYKPDDSSNDRPSRDDRGSRYSRDNSRPSRGRSDKLLRKQESFYSGGSAKFNESLQKKLYEILGGKTCSSCGSNDERALGICDINGNQISGDTRRGSAASSWGKYISAPDTAKKELKVFCSNCNDAVVPTKLQEDRPRSKSKKSKYFPR